MRSRAARAASLQDTLYWNRCIHDARRNFDRLGGLSPSPVAWWVQTNKRPDVPAPAQFRSGEPQPGPVSLGETKWFDLFQDETLRGLIQESLQANYDIRIAAQRVLQAQGQFDRDALGTIPAN